MDSVGQRLKRFALLGPDRTGKVLEWSAMFFNGRLYR